MKKPSTEKINPSDDGGLATLRNADKRHGKLKKEVLNMPSNFDLVNDRVNEFVSELNAHGYKVHHTAWAGGYLTRTPEYVTIRRHSTRKFKGCVLEIPSFSSSRYHIRIYFVKKS